MLSAGTRRVLGHFAIREANSRPASFVSSRRGHFRIDRRRKLASLIVNEIVLQELQEFLAEWGDEPAETLLDIGAGAKPYFPVYQAYFDSCVAVDVPYSAHDTSGVDVFASADALPFDDASFDVVICTEVVEHCPDPAAVFGEIARVLKPGGRAFVTTPFLVPLHEMPYDFYRYTPSALQHLAATGGLNVVSLRPKGECGAVVIDFLVRPSVKVWRKLSKVVEIDLARPANPLVFASIVLPQLLYVAVWRRVRGNEEGCANRLYTKLSYATLGYVTTLIKPQAEPEACAVSAAP